MNKVAVFILSLTLIAGAGTSSFAMSHMSGGKMMMMMPKCSAGDPVVAVNMNTKMYRMHDKMSGMHMGAKGKMAMHRSMMMHNMKMMCKSNADAMGAHMMKSSMMKNSM